MDSETLVYWISEPPTACQMSGRTIDKTFVDGRLEGSTQWGFFHPDVFLEYGGVFGLGRGQLYEQQDSGRWLKVEG